MTPFPSKSGLAVPLLALLLFAWALEASAAAVIQRPRERKPAPAFTVKDLDGRSVSLSDYRGRVVVLHFWATWCAPCRSEMPRLVDFYSRYAPRGVAVLAVSVDRGSKEAVRSFASEYTMTFPVLLDADAAVRRSYYVAALPTTYFIDSDGVFAAMALGEVDWSGDEVEALMKELLSGR